MRTLLLCISFLTLQVCSGATYYVRTDGNNGNTGTADTSGGAWRNIWYAALNAVAGDTIRASAGTFNESVTNSASGTGAAPITFVGTRGASGEWLTIVDPSLLITNAWVLAPEVGAGIWKQTGMPFATREMTIGGLHVGYVSTNGDMSASILNAYKTNWTTGLEVLGQPTGVSVTNNANFLYGSFWDGIEALYCSTGSVTYLRLRDGSDPSSLTIRCAPNNELKTLMDVQRAAWDVTGRSFITISNLDIRGGFAGIKLSTGTHNVNVRSNRLDNGWVNVYDIGQSWSNNIVDNTFVYQWYGGPSGSWETDPATGYRKKANQYLVCKHLMGSGSEAQRHIYLLGSGSNIVVSGNSLVGGAGNGMNIVETTVVGGIVVRSNAFWQTCSAGLFASKNHVGTLIYGNDFRDCNANARFEQDTSGTTAISAYIYRNTFWQPDNIGDQIYCFINSTPLAYHPTYWVYHNSMSGGQGCWFVSANTVSAVGMTNTFVINNVFSDGVYVTGSAGWLLTTKIGAWDYNLSTPPNITDPAWFGTHNIKSTTNQWVNVLGMDFSLPTGSQAIDQALDTSSTFTLNGVSYPALPDTGTQIGSGWDMGAFETLATRRVMRVTNLHVNHAASP